jgi:hypothetical protein
MPVESLIDGKPPDTPSDDHCSAVTVVFTTWSATATALRTAVALANGWRSSLTIVAAQVVPWPADLHQDHVPVTFKESRLREMAAWCEVKTSVNVYLCRDPVETLCSYIPPERIVVVGARKARWRNPDLRLAAALRGAGFEVIVTHEK